MKRAEEEARQRIPDRCGFVLGYDFALGYDFERARDQQKRWPHWIRAESAKKNVSGDTKRRWERWETVPRRRLAKWSIRRWEVVKAWSQLRP
jgi:hypothetical protein